MTGLQLWFPDREIDPLTSVRSTIFICGRAYVTDSYRCM
jgi:hypothetical protein